MMHPLCKLFGHKWEPVPVWVATNFGGYYAYCCKRSKGPSRFYCERKLASLEDAERFNEMRAYEKQLVKEYKVG